MTYHPKSIVLSALFLSTKTENHYTSLRSFASQIPKTSPEDVLATEFLVTQGLRFTFDVRHPQRGLEGGFMELLAIAGGDGSSNSLGNIDGLSLAEEMLQKPLPGASELHTQTLAQLKSRIQKTHGKASDILKTSALLTDAYFLYTPAQIWLSSLMAVDTPLAEFYINSKFKDSSTENEDLINSQKLKVLGTVKECSSLLLSPTTTAHPSPSEITELTRIDKKLFHCRNPDKIDLVGLNKAQKREGAETTAGNSLDEKIIKKRRMEREKSAKDDDVFGGALIK
jgi:cyclin H